MLILDIPVIAITGSAGKTTTKEMIAAILHTRWNIFKSSLNHNITSYTRKYAKQITSLHQAAVLEYGMTRKGAIRQHCRIIQPNMGVITNVGSAHIGHFGGSIRMLAQAKSELIENMKPGALLFINADDENSKLLKLSGFTGKVIRIGIIRPAQVMAKHIHYSPQGMSFMVKLGHKDHSFFIPAFGGHNVYNALYAIAVACELGFTPQEIANGLRTFNRPRRRLHFKPGRNGITVIDDSYSSNPQALKSAIEVLINVGEAPRIVVLGDMLELGSVTNKKHKEIGKYLADKNIQFLCTLGTKSALIGSESVANGFDPNKVLHFTSRKDLHEHLAKIIKSGGTVLVKGSHTSNMRITADFLTKARKVKN
ncbi:MAG: UDP-N-acetylmuramoyl-tripeptide--D-alanyl-D-alanine ligase [Methylocystaceae bacterium]